MFLSDLKTRFRGEVFDYMVEQTQIALHDPVVVKKLGGLAAELSSVTDTLFLPDIRHGEIVIPNSQKDTINPVFFPMTSKEALDAGRLTRSVHQKPVRLWEITEPLYSEAYDIKMDLDEIWETMEPRQKPKDPVKPKGRGSDPLRTVAAMRRCVCIEDNRFATSRPIIFVRQALMLKGSKACGGTLAHEAVHAWDALRDGPLYEGTPYLSATEYRAYHVDDAIDTRQSWFERPCVPQEVEAFRREHADPARPFHPTQPMIDFMVENKYIHV